MSVASKFIFRPRTAWIRYAAALGMVGGALAAKLLLAELITRDMPALLFFIAITASALFGGRGPGLLGVALCTLCDEYFFNAPYGSWRMNDPSQALRLLLFVGEAVSICLICSWLRVKHVAARNALRRARKGEAAARALQQRVLNVIDHERMRLGHDLHDGLGQQLTAMSLLARSLEERLTRLAPREAEEAGALKDLSKLAIDWTHDLCRTLSPADDALDDLPEMLKELAEKTSRVFRLRCYADCLLTTNDLSPVYATHLYRIAQEAITNAARHGNARTVTVRLQHDDAVLRLEIEDDGTGIGNTLASEEGMGLRIMRYRAEMVGAEFEISRRAEGGTRVVLSRAAVLTAAEYAHAAV